MGAPGGDAGTPGRSTQPKRPKVQLRLEGNREAFHVTPPYPLGLEFQTHTAAKDKLSWTFVNVFTVTSLVLVPSVIPYVCDSL